jgi:hypothetical protein
MSTKNLVTINMGTDLASQFVEGVDVVDAYYVTASKHTPYQGNSDQTINIPVESVNALSIAAYSDMIFGKRVKPTDTSLLILRNEWQANTVVNAYDDIATDLYTNTAYVSVNAGATTFVYKCLYNNNNSPSLVEPSGTDTTTFETPEDGYIWKYMYSANDYIMSKFSSNTYIPLVVDSNVVSSAVGGAIDVILVESSAIGYNNYNVGSFETTSNIKISGNPLLYGIGATASTTNDYYNDCGIKVTSGACSGQYRIIQDYYISGGQKIIVLDNAFTGTILATDTYEIYPHVYVYDTGTAMSSNCIARALISNTAGNTISSVEILSSGVGYITATAAVKVNASVGVTSNTSLRPIIPPSGGHGSNPASELGAKYAGISVKFIENESVLTTKNDFRTVSLLENPTFSNVQVYFDNTKTVGSFTQGETVYQYKATQLTGTAQVFSNTTVTGTSTLFNDSFATGDYVLVTDTVHNIFTTVNTASSNTSLILNTNSSFSNTNCKVYRVTPTRMGVVNSISSNTIALSNVSVINILTNTTTKLVGETSYCTSVIDQGASVPVGINGRNVNNFTYFTQLTHLNGTLISGSFQEDETVYQDTSDTNTRPTAKFHSLISNTDMYVTETVNRIYDSSDTLITHGTITGNTSNAQFTINNIYQGDLEKGSGKILYVENFAPISRANNQNETIKIILEF